MSRILAFDLSLTASGWATGYDGHLGATGLIVGKGDGVPRLIFNRNRVLDKVEEVKPDLVVFEDLSVGSNMSYAKEIAGVTYMIRAELVTDKIPYVVVAPTSLKKFVCGSAGSPKAPVKKEHMLKNMATRFGHDVNDNNVCDAIGLAYVGMALVGEYEPGTQPQRDALVKVRENGAAVLSRLEFRPPAVAGAVVRHEAADDRW